MTNTTTIAKRYNYGLLALMFAVSIVLPVFISKSVSAAQITARSIEMSNSSIGTTSEGQGVTYNITFTPTASTVRSIVVDFCAETPLIGSSSCTLPTGMTVGTTTPTASQGTWTGTLINTNRTLVLTASADESLPASAFNVEVSGFTNPNAVGQFYARIVTYATSAGANGYVEDDLDAVAAHTDAGAVAISTTEQIQISAAVVETLVFCVSAVAPGANCTATSAPSLTLGSGTPEALSTSNVDTAAAFFQLSTNASGNTYINMKSSAVSGGLNNGPTNDIDPVDGGGTMAAIVAGTENFGMHVNATGNSGTSGTVTGDAAYSSDTLYNMEVPEVTSTYGDTIASAAGAVDDYNVEMEFAATVSNTTSAGLYTANISLIATSSY